jgi:hypothetical protein
LKTNLEAIPGKRFGMIVTKYSSTTNSIRNTESAAV